MILDPKLYAVNFILQVFATLITKMEVCSGNHFDPYLRHYNIFV